MWENLLGEVKKKQVCQKVNSEKTPTRWALFADRDTWSYKNPYKWPKIKGVTGVISTLHVE